MADQERILKKFVANAKAIISNQVGMPVGCQQMQKFFFWLKIPPEKYPVFKEYLEVVVSKGLPISMERLSWNRSSLKAKDKILNALNSKYYDRIIDACWKIIDAYEKN